MKHKSAISGAGILYLLGCILFCIGIFITGIIYWIKAEFYLTYQQLLFLLTSPLVGADKDIVISCLKACIPFFTAIVIYVFLTGILLKLNQNYNITAQIKLSNKSEQSVNLLNMFALCWLSLGAGVFLFSFSFSNDVLNIAGYYNNLKNPTRLYENYYIDPSTVLIKAPKTKKNLILIYMESMETTFASIDAGGMQPENYIPNLTELAKDNYSFSNNRLLGGSRAMPGTTWTIGALFATSSGLPYSFPFGDNNGNIVKEFAGGVIALGDILAENGYSNTFLCGSDAVFGGRKKFFEQHGNYAVYDYFSAINDGYISQDYKVWWGLEDKKLYEIAKDLLTESVQINEPFNLTMLTVDTHFTGGYVCEICESKYDERLANVFACADNQIAGFLEWCKTQAFYNDSVIIIIGDHPTMETPLIDGIPMYNRTVYNCFINPQISGNKISLIDREFTSMDLFPTILSALGFKIEGDRLGLGTNLFAGTPTLLEVMGFDLLSFEISGYSDYYINSFL